MRAAWHRFINGIVALVRATARDRDLNDELQGFLDAAIDAKMADGLSRKQAVRAARLEMGSLDAVKERTRDAGWEQVVESVWQDGRYACRALRKSPAFAAAAVVTLALGIGGTTAVFSVVDALFWRSPAGVANASSVRRVFVKRNAGSMQAPSGMAGFWTDSAELTRATHAFAAAASYQLPTLVDLGRGEAAEQVRACLISADFLGLLGIKPARGRFFSDEDDDVPGRRPVVVVSHRFWRTRFGGTPDAIGRSIVVNGRPLEIIGVTASGFDGIESDPIDLWLPSAMATPLGLEEGDWRDGMNTLSGNIRHLVRLSTSTTDILAVRQGESNLQHAAEAYANLDPTPEVILAPLVLAGLPDSTWSTDLSLWTALAAGLLLLIASANVANLLLARAVKRRRELAMRLALGASAWRIARQQLTENVVLGLLGGGVGLAVAYSLMQVMQQFPVPPSATQLNGRLLAFTGAVSLITALLFGVLPALRAARLDAIAALKGTHTIGGSSRSRLSWTLVGIQVSLSLTLLVGATLFVRSLGQVSSVEPGVDWRHLIVVSADWSTPRYSSETREAFLETALARLASLPGVEHAAVAYSPPLTGWAFSTFWRLAGRETQAHAGVYLNLVGPDYFETVGTRLVQGRGILPSDRGGTGLSEFVGVVNKRMARLLADDGNAIGLCVTIGPQRRCTRIVGIVDTQRDVLLDTTDGFPMIFRPRQQPYGMALGVTPVLLAHTTDDPNRHTNSVRAALQGLRPDLPYVKVESMRERLRPALVRFQLGSTLFGLFAALAMVLAGVELYGLLGYFVAERTAEIGVRRALGAPDTSVARLVVQQSLVPVAAGLGAGLAIAWFGAQYLSSLLFGIQPHDLPSFATAAAFLFVTAALAALVPTRRALRVDPMVALKQE